MPPLNTIKILGDMKFVSHSLQLPVDWKQPSGDPDSGQYDDSIPVNEKLAIPGQLPVPWFQPRNRHKYHQDSCDEIGKAFKKLHDDMLDAVVYAHGLWKPQAKFQDLKLAAVCAIGAPGCLDGPELESNIKNAPTCVSYTGHEAKYRDAVAAGVSKCFKNWQDQVTVPGLPWYPPLAVFPGPQAAPVPNIPMPLIACISAKMSDIITPFTMKDEMVNALDGGLKQEDPDKQHEALFDAIATVLSMGFLLWLTSQQVMLVLGKGPIPTFAPPFVPVGPVVMGDNVAAPGHLAA